MSRSARSRAGLLAGTVALVLAASAAQAAERPEVTAAAAVQRQQVIDWHRDLHQHPELPGWWPRSCGGWAWSRRPGSPITA
mgnify:CR=1 FL=1